MAARTAISSALSLCIGAGLSGCDPSFWYDLGEALREPPIDSPDPISSGEVDAGEPEGIDPDEPPSLIDDPGQKGEARLALTWGFIEDSTLPASTTFASCHGSPVTSGRERSPSCDPYEGDTSCAQALPILCFHPDYSPAPETSFDLGFYSGWTGGRLASSSPVVGTRLTSQAVADEICARELGEGFRMAEFHDGNGGWGFVGNTDPRGVNTSARNWLRIDDQSANCWD